jgi:hypothetical protein
MLAVIDSMEECCSSTAADSHYYRRMDLQQAANYDFGYRRMDEKRHGDCPDAVDIGSAID